MGVSLLWDLISVVLLIAAQMVRRGLLPLGDGLLEGREVCVGVHLVQLVLVLQVGLLLGPLAPPQLSASRLALFGRDHWVDISKAKAAGFAPATPLAEGLAATVAWYRAEGLIR